MYNEIVDLEEIADKVHDNLTKVYIVDTLKYYDLNKWGDLTIDERKELVEWVYQIYLKTDLNLSLGCICDSTMENRKAILKRKYSKWDFIQLLAERWEN